MRYLLVYESDIYFRAIFLRPDDTTCWFYQPGVRLSRCPNSFLRSSNYSIYYSLRTLSSARSSVPYLAIAKRRGIPGVSLQNIAQGQGRFEIDAILFRSPFFVSH